MSRLNGLRLFGPDGVIPSIYRNRDYQAHRLTDLAFEHFNTTDALLVATTGCLDAPGMIPTGSVYQAARLPTMSTIDRGMTLAEWEQQRALARRLINEVLVTERNEK